MTEALAARTLDENEQVVARGLSTFVEVGKALGEIRDARQYRDAGYSSFEDYLSERWDMSRPRAYQLIDAAGRVAGLSTKVDGASASAMADTRTPPVVTERVARELPREPEHAREVWAATTERVGPSPTARQVAEVRDELYPKQAPAPTSAPVAAPAAPEPDPEPAPAPTPPPGPAPVPVLLDPAATSEQVEQENQRTLRYSETRVIAGALTALRHRPATLAHARESAALIDPTYLNPGDEITADAARASAAFLLLFAAALEGDTP
ncbi:hypothetical protein [Paraconexibacter algicola]|uniref:Uncharacterized protein n=1 Tax=Paraconexibacter algicola TaxID=2133960 RepID=A0A2T4UE29_9ACTN|nr:hypothetical protein [Paraconexibacter algicola]PTL55767.1 hypothetical protein C7Y72_19250 [Paraconexibacter algicola]